MRCLSHLSTPTTIRGLYSLSFVLRTEQPSRTKEHPVSKFAAERSPSKYESGQPRVRQIVTSLHRD